jgi:hypothetical protein
MKHAQLRRLMAVAFSVTFGGALACSSSTPSDDAGGTGGSGGVGGSTTAGAGGAGGTTGGSGGTGAQDGGAGDVAVDAGSAIDEACAHLARVSCQKYGECLPWYIPLEFGDIDTCIQQYAATLCRNRLGLEGSGDTPATTEACAAARRAATCAQWFDNDLALSACLSRPGTRTTGAVCGTASQCQSAQCVVPIGMECGRCGGPLVGEGGGCTSSSECASNLQCIDLKCGLPRGLGQRCPNVSACQYDLTCWNGYCVVGTSKAGESCDATTACRVRDGLTCRDGVCIPWQFDGPGEPCIADDSRFCAGTGTCTTTGVSAVCIPGARDGEPCDHSVGPFCMPSASCIQGFCKTPDIRMCK